MPRGWTQLSAMGLAATLALSACSEDGTGAPPTQAEHTLEHGRFALINLNAATGHSAQATRELEVTGQFVNYTAPDVDWALGALDLWVPTEERMAWDDTCELKLDALLDPTLDSAYLETLPSHRIELLNAGDVQLVADTAAELESRYVPDLLVYMSGMVYRLDPGHGFTYQPDAAYLLEGQGQDALGSFAVSVRAPQPMVLATINGDTFGGPIDATVPADGTLALEWLAYEPQGGQIYLDLYSDAHSPAPLMSCTVADDGRFTLPRDAMLSLSERYPGFSMRLVARRAAISQFPLDGVDWAQALFVTSDLATLQF